MGDLFGGKNPLGALPIIGPMIQRGEAQRDAETMAQNQMDFQLNMASTQHQREVEDMKKAGLNPILSAGGQGAAAPSGASAPSAPAADSQLGLIVPALSLLQKNRELDQADQRIKNETDMTQSVIGKNTTDADLNRAKTVTEKNEATKTNLTSQPYKWGNELLKSILNPQPSRIQKGIPSSQQLPPGNNLP